MPPPYPVLLFTGPRIVDEAHQITRKVVEETLEKMKREREEQQKRYREEETRRYEAHRLQEIDEKRWNKFREYAVNWDERKRLLAFLGEVEVRPATEGDATVSDRTLRDWVEWAKAKAEALNPFGGGAVGMFESIANVKQWS